MSEMLASYSLLLSLTLIMTGYMLAWVGRQQQAAAVRNMFSMETAIKIVMEVVIIMMTRVEANDDIEKLVNCQSNFLLKLDVKE